MPSEFSIKRLLPLYIVIFFGFLGYSMMITLFTPLFMYAQEGMVSVDSSIGYRVILLGIVLALFPLAQFFSSPILGALSDHFGRRPILLISLYSAPVCYALIAFSLTFHSIALLMLGCFIAGITQANIVVAQSAIVDIAPREERNRLFGYIYLSASSAYIAGPLLGGKLTNSSTVSWFDYPTPFWVVCGFLVVVLFWTQAVFLETKKEKGIHVNYLGAFVSLLTIFTSRRLRKIYFINFLLYIAIFGYFRCYPMYIVNAFHVNASKLSEYIAWVAVPIVLVNLGVTSVLSKRFSPKILTIWASFFTGVFMLLIVIPDAQAALWVTLFLTSAALALSLPSSSTMLSFAASPAEQGLVMGNNQSLQVAAEALSAFAGGLLASISIAMPLVVMSLVACITGIILFSVRKSIPDHH